MRKTSALAPHAALRSEVVPETNAPPQTLVQLPLPYSAATAEHNQPGAEPDEVQPPSRHPWAVLLKHVFAVDITVCVKCAGPMLIVDFRFHTASHRTRVGARWTAPATTADAAPCHRPRLATAPVVCLNHCSHGAYPRSRRWLALAAVSRVQKHANATFSPHL
jgi:hypothetical protein